MRSTIGAAVAFAAGVVCGVVGSVTLRHEIWPLAARVGLLRVYALAGLALFGLVIIWYMRLQRRMAIALPPASATLLMSALRFLLVVLALGGAYLLGLFFVAVH
ncbi:MAG: hypothetical protein ONB17_11565 [candidate division KSB1 bacterium]|nr:hypothetical protein [candidate division KSB1 bacterium]MDZ7378262.1 hypothetical protein [candidate division KSB1 bacterium]MDZ7385750.1 hypothetical protein [candidate division KSB1 bacterium]MDZ7392539.1 hypothetical protein [candidate division KSB1 bacterium]MDZ7412361.1 hypothetical protein [candidate division KSB1 bacterium]